MDKCNQIPDELKRRGILATEDNRNEKIGYKIREAQVDKVPYMLVIGDKEAEQNLVSVRHRNDNLGTMTFDEFYHKIREEIDTKAIN
ncbi:MAG: hypothetical protein K2L88_05870 [Clostridiales bacterium]|nr:hypothetical protein [Clostridiales bacterium]